MILGPPGPCFVEIDDAVSALQAERGDSREVVFFWQFDVSQVPKGAIVYNFDLPLVHFEIDHMRAVAKRASEVWDFSARNIETWQRIGVDAKHVPVGFHPSMVRFDRAAQPDIDVVFFGSINARRLRVLNALQDVGLTVVHGSPDPKERDALLARARTSINMLFYESGVYPTLRAAHLLANDVPYVGEISPEYEWDPTHEDFVRYDALLPLIAETARANVKGARAAFAKRPMVLPS